VLFIADSLQLVQRKPYQARFEGFRDFKIGGQAIHTVQYAACVLLANEAAMPNSGPHVT
jgi:hypothetical protein